MIYFYKMIITTSKYIDLTYFHEKKIIFNVETLRNIDKSTSNLKSISYNFMKIY